MRRNLTESSAQSARRFLDLQTAALDRLRLEHVWRPLGLEDVLKLESSGWTKLDPTEWLICGAGRQGSEIDSRGPLPVRLRLRMLPY